MVGKKKIPVNNVFKILPWYFLLWLFYWSEFIAKKMDLHAHMFFVGLKLLIQGILHPTLVV